MRRLAPMAAIAALLSLPLALAGLARWQWTATAAPAGAPVQTLGQVLAVVGNRAARPPAALPASHPARDKVAAAPDGAAFVCVGERCSLPVTEPQKLADAVAAMRT